MMLSTPQQTILVLHGPTVDPYPFIQRLIESPSPLTDEPVEVSWKLDNKYYTAEVTLQVLEIGPDDPVQAKDIPVIIYLFQGDVDAVPATVVKLLMAEPRDVALAIRIAPSLDSEEQDGLERSRPVVESSWEALEEMFEEVGMEVINEAHQEVEDDDERPISPLEQIRQTLMTHMWPEMVRKPLGRSATSISIGTEPDSPEGSEEIRAQAPEQAGLSPVSPTGPRFPISFESPAGPSRRPTQPLTTDVAAATADDARAKEATAFPGLDELRTQIQLEDLERFERGDMNRLDAMDDDLWEMLDESGPGAEDYARLDEWLDRDEVPPDPGAEEEDDRPQVEETQVQDDSQVVPHGKAEQEPGFDDDFDDFAPFQSAPPEATFESLDPTPLLLHLQNIRTELAGVVDADERRVRAGKEVARVMRDLGMGGDFDLDDIDKAKDDQR